MRIPNTQNPIASGNGVDSEQVRVHLPTFNSTSSAAHSAAYVISPTESHHSANGQIFEDMGALPNEPWVHDEFPPPYPDRPSSQEQDTISIDTSDSSMPKSPPISSSDERFADSQRSYQRQVNSELSCSLLPNEPATWIIRGSQMRLCKLAASTLIHFGRIKLIDLELFFQPTYMANKDPTDPFSGLATATVDTVTNVVGASLKATKDITYNLARGFHNAPSLYGDTVREREEITGAGSGFKAAGKGLVLGISDGISGVFVQPVEGAQKEGAVGFFKGFGKGIGGLACKPAAGVCGLPGYAFQGIYEEIQKRRTRTGPSCKKVSSGQLRQEFEQQGNEKYDAASYEVRVHILRAWCEKGDNFSRGN